MTSWARLVGCAKCGKHYHKRELYPNMHTKSKPKPKMKDRYRYCQRCWTSIRSNDRNRDGGKWMPGSEA